MRRKVRVLRHWKQRFHKDAEFIWRRPVTYAGESCAPGDPIPDALATNKAKLRRFWESGTIELAQFEDPDVLTGRTASEEAVRQLELMRARDGAAADDFAETEDEEFDPKAEADETWLGGSEEGADDGD